MSTIILKKQWIDKQKEVSGLITILKRYNFTIEENTPSDVDVALDPELLGKVFENLLGAFNPETEESARKQSGSFYTPREIVNYMTNESLTAYLKQKVGEDWQNEERRNKASAAYGHSE
jgi:type I restriction-modification system DNA methylase subunit